QASSFEQTKQVSYVNTKWVAVLLRPDAYPRKNGRETTCKEISAPYAYNVNYDPGLTSKLLLNYSNAYKMLRLSCAETTS
ncbi:14217_t:CDS:2, partial [Gigaspora rosea]